MAHEYVKTRTVRGKRLYWIDLRAVVPKGCDGRIWSQAGVRFSTREHAEGVAAQILGKIGEGLSAEVVLDLYRGWRAKRNLFSDWWQRYDSFKQGQAEAGEISARWLRDLRSTARHSILPFERFGRTTVFDLTDGIMQDWIRWLRHDRHLKDHSIRQARIVMKNFFKFVVQHTSSGSISSWSPPTVPVVSIPDADPDILSVEEQLRIVEQMPEPYRGPCYAMCLTIRPGEVRALEIADYSEGFLMISKAAKNETASAPVGPTKTNEKREVPVDEHAHPAGPMLAQWITDNVDPRARLQRGLLFPSRSGGMYSHSALTERWHKACDAAAVPRVPMYQGTRHSAATHLYADGLRDAELRVLMGHRPGSKHTERYRQIAKRTGLLNAMKRISVARLSLAANHEDPTKP